MKVTLICTPPIRVLFVSKAEMGVPLMGIPPIQVPQIRVPAMHVPPMP